MVPVIKEDVVRDGGREATLPAAFSLPKSSTQGSDEDFENTIYLHGGGSLKTWMEQRAKPKLTDFYSSRSNLPSAALVGDAAFTTIANVPPTANKDCKKTLIRFLSWLCFYCI
ncbi:Hypothetical predicted protein [Xyrichtys novacula]|uniref:Uncharacterized protein n=1 Tax=Xyrichtys novacula TaxID=13765 RepID=A0AAV1FPJ0_XYRNO|nr:Hypothetical predicted protein [Xyrichtys novacula]